MSQQLGHLGATPLEGKQLARQWKGDNLTWVDASAGGSSGLAYTVSNTAAAVYSSAADILNR
jgi:hypothetical protein